MKMNKSNERVITSETSLERQRYNAEHWSREENEKEAIAQYLRLGEKAFNKTMFQFLIAMAGDVSGKKMLDYGGGAGIMAIPFAKAGAEIVLVDAEANGLHTAGFYARREGAQSKIRTIHSESFPLELKSERFDIVVAKDIIEHIPDDQKFVSDLSDCQSWGGILLSSIQTATH